MLLHAEHHETITDAFAARDRIKGWSRARKEAYMRGDYPTRVVPAKPGAPLPPHPELVEG